MRPTDAEISAAMSVIGRLGAGKPKRFTAEELAKRTARIQEVNARRRANLERVFAQALAQGLAGKGEA